MKVTLLLTALLAFSFGSYNSAASAAGPAATAAPQGNQNLITCASNNGKRNFCAIGDPRQSVQMVRQISNSACIQGQTWGNDNRGIWVDRGCRAQFSVIAYGGSGPTWWNSGGGRPGGRPHDGACFFTSANYTGNYFCQARGTTLN